ncbi:MAG: DoxX family protein [Bacteriovoracia bacterium]
MERTNQWDRLHPERSDYDITDVIRFQKEDVGIFLLRIAIGGLMLFHGINKVIYGTEQVGEILTRVGIPSFFSFGVFVGEVLAPILVIIGYKVRLGGFLIALNMLIAILLVHSSQLDEINPTGGWMIELNALYLLGAIAITFLGAGRISISKGRGALD